MRPLILITNDDGIHANGIKRLVDCVCDAADLYVVAPNEPHSGQSSAFTVNSPLHIIEHPDYNGAKMFAVTGTPVDCVKLAMHHILPRRPDFVLSGINHGSNAGNSVIYSGTMGAAFEACMLGIPAVGYSLLSHDANADFSKCMGLIKEMTRMVMAEGLPQGVCLNVNFPANVEIEGVKVVRSAKSHWTEEYQTYTDPHGTPFYWLTGRIVNEEADSTDTDLYWLDRNYATVVPVRADQNATDVISKVKLNFQSLL
jgi:5'-nucleotidase